MTVEVLSYCLSSVLGICTALAFALGINSVSR